MKSGQILLSMASSGASSNNTVQDNVRIDQLLQNFHHSHRYHYYDIQIYRMLGIRKRRVHSLA